MIKGVKMKFLRNLLIVMFLAWMGTFTGCSDSTSSLENITEDGSFWFACEFDSLNNCLILDDDGYQFTNDGKIYDLEEATQQSEPECGESPCFRADNSSITVKREFIGTYTYDSASSTLTINIDPGARDACTENVIWNISDDFFETQSLCLSFESTHAKRYTGEVNIN